jgi:hypothetical protein
VVSLLRPTMARETESLDSGFRVVQRYLSGWVALTGAGTLLCSSWYRAATASQLMFP